VTGALSASAPIFGLPLTMNANLNDENAKRNEDTVERIKYI